MLGHLRSTKPKNQFIELVDISIFIYQSIPPGADAEADAVATADTVADTGAYAGTYTGADAAADSGTDAGTDAGAYAEADAGTDTGADAGTVTGEDAGTCAENHVSYLEAFHDSWESPENVLGKSIFIELFKEALETKMVPWLVTHFLSALQGNAEQLGLEEVEPPSVLDIREVTFVLAHFGQP